MKARQVSAAFSSVYAIGMIDQVRVIERGARRTLGEVAGGERQCQADRARR